VRVRVSLTIPPATVLRSVEPAEVLLLPDGRRQVSFGVTVGANCRWSLSVRRRAWWDWRAVDPIDVEREDGSWVELATGGEPVVVIVSREACNAERHTIRLRVARDAEPDRVLGRVEFVVAPVQR
jgi:hypothetical protein